MEHILQKVVFILQAHFYSYYPMFVSDESPTTCSVFLEEGGMDLFLDVLVTFQDECTVETKVLGLINNIAEVSQLRPRLMVPGFMTRLRQVYRYFLKLMLITPCHKNFVHYQKRSTIREFVSPN